MVRELELNQNQQWCISHSTKKREPHSTSPTTSQGTKFTRNQAKFLERAM